MSSDKQKNNSGTSGTSRSAAYAALLADVSDIYEQTVLKTVNESEHSKLESYWQIGRRIVDEVQQGNDGAIYGKRIISRLSEDLTQKYGDGFKRRNINYIRSLAVNYGTPAFKDNLSWSHYRALLSIKDDAERRQLEQRAAREKLSCKSLQQLIRQQNPASKRRRLSFGLSPRAAQPGIVELVRDTLNPNGPPLLDLGFNICRPANIAAMLRQPTGTFWLQQANGGLRQIDCPPGMRYCYRAQVLDVVDGDTVGLRLHLGWSTFIEDRLRLRGVDAMAPGTAEGDRARQGLLTLLDGAGMLTVVTYGNDRHGRYVADLIDNDGLYINKELVDQGYAAFLKM